MVGLFITHWNWLIIGLVIMVRVQDLLESRFCMLDIKLYAFLNSGHDAGSVWDQTLVNIDVLENCNGNRILYSLLVELGSFDPNHSF